MYFLRMSVENTRCFGPEQTLDLSNGNGAPAQWTVILGENGVGKTTLLQALATAWVTTGRAVLEEASPDHMERLRLYAPTWTLFAPLGQRSGAGASTLSWTTSADPLGRVPPPSRTFDFRQSASAAPSVPKERGYNGPQVAASVHRSTPKLEPDTLVHPLCAYGAGRRLTRETGGKSCNGLDSLFSGDAKLRNPAEWLMQADYAALRAGRNKAAAKRRVEQVKAILCTLLPGVTDMHIDVAGEAVPEPEVLFETPYGRVPIHQLSHGYQTMIAWTVDMASRLVETYPDSRNPLAEPSVCLVDEIDLHMHPRWQRDIMRFLGARFPKTQFIVTAHSPLIVQTATDANVVLLRRAGKDKDDHAVIENRKHVLRGARVDQILTSDLFGLESARPPEYADLLDERRTLLSKSRLTAKDKRRLGELDRIADELPVGSTPEDREAMDIIRRAAQHLRSGS